ncbi:uncharacterized protein CXQ87_002076 [Candidozyma duobushaemuli]|uniref:Golgi apparatus membrane protein TVP15 n=1 Tax=Candidozyma duobushaemuli TaxID=1231522 RepID=A0A2V1A8F9_9ASCO|nr:uncharacterized protein CXQ87_002076 [[Candida] duobushaemulonis]PVH13955.1 hypothetical protein CXQ87_002076 [[Candida] duobushaemulonis]
MDAISGQDLNGVFKGANLAVAALSFIIGIYIIGFGAVLGLLEFRVPSEAYTYGSFLFSFIGRGVFYTLIGASINGASWFRLFAGILIFVIGLVYIALEAVPSISPPENMSPEGISIGVQDEDVV